MVSIPLRFYRELPFFWFFSLLYLLTLGLWTESTIASELKTSTAHTQRISSSCKTESPLLPGMTVARQMGPIDFIIHLSKATAQVEVTARMGSVQVSGLIMTVAKPTVTLNIADGKHRVSGSLGAFFCDPSINSHILADFSMKTLNQGKKNAANNSNKKTLEVYRGDLITWESPQRRVLNNYSVFILPELEARVQLIDNYLSGTPLVAQLTFYYSNQVIASYLSMSTITEIDMQQASVGNVRIEKGGKINFRPATSLQTGQLNLNVSVSTLNPENTVQYNGALAEWTWIKGRGDNCRG